MSNSKVLEYFMNLPQGNNVIAEYVWLGGEQEYRSKARTLPKTKYTPETLPIWNYDGSSTK
jgi:glutamine synthetase